MKDRVGKFTGVASIKHDYGGIGQCKFNIKAFFDAPMLIDQGASEVPLLMAPDAPHKKGKTEAYGTTTSPSNQTKVSSPTKFKKTETARGKLASMAKKNA